MSGGGHAQARWVWWRWVNRALWRCGAIAVVAWCAAAAFLLTVCFALAVSVGARRNEVWAGAALGVVDALSL